MGCFTMESYKVFFSRDFEFNESNLTKQSKELTEIKATERRKYPFQ